MGRGLKAVMEAARPVPALRGRHGADRREVKQGEANEAGQPETGEAEGQAAGRWLDSEPQVENSEWDSVKGRERVQPMETPETFL